MFSAATLAVLAALSSNVAAAPAQFLSVGDPLESELRTLDLFPSAAIGGRIAVPHLGSRPLELREMEGDAAPGAPAWPVAAFSLARLERVLGRDAREGFVLDPAHGSTPRLLERGDRTQRFELSAGLEGGAQADRESREFTSNSGLHVRAALAVDRWLIFTHLVAGKFDHARTFADPLIANTDVTTLTEESYVAYGAADGAWGARIGRDRWHWGPGDEGSLILSRTSAPLAALAFRVRIAALHVDAIALNATLDAASGEQLAAHRAEWQPNDRLRLGFTEAARYHASGWSPLYAAGLIPYFIVQRMLVQDQPDSGRALRNNVMVGVDASWRVADGTRIYGELLVDDLHAKTSQNPDKLAWQVGWNGAGMIGAERLTWGGELTRVWRYVYTSSFGESFESQGRPLGFPTGPDSRRLRAHVEWDPGVDWQLAARAAATDHGEGSLADAWVQGGPLVNAAHFLGVIERTREAELGARWWPAGSVSAALTGGWRWIDNLAHVAGASRSGPYARAELQLTR